MSQISDALTILSMGRHTRLGDVIDAALAAVPFETLAADKLAGAALNDRRLLFVLSVDESGVEPDYWRMLSFLRTHPGSLEGSVGAILIDGESEYYTRDLARTLALSASMAGCRLMDKPLVAATKSLTNFDLLSSLHGISRYTAYQSAAASLVERLMRYHPARFARPRLLVLHASDPERSAAYAVGHVLMERLKADMDIAEMTLMCSAVCNCSDCGDADCLHYLEQEGCFYGAPLPDAVLPAILENDALLLICPGCNGAPGAHFSALINRFGELIARGTPVETALFAIVASDDGGGDIVARQLLDGFSLHSGSFLPPRFCLFVGGDTGETLAAPGMTARIAAYADNMRGALLTV